MPETPNETVFLSHSEAETEAFAAEFAGSLHPGDFIAFFGGLGSGKTAFVRGLARTLCPDAHVSSPTYAIVNEYEGPLPLFHFDLYRVTDEDSLFAVGFYDYFDRPGVIAAEWCENIPFALPADRFDVTFEKLSDVDRRIVIVKRENAFLS